jgi:hypothetical protein
MNKNKILALYLCRIEYIKPPYEMIPPSYKKVNLGMALIDVSNLDSVSEYNVPVYRSLSHRASSSQFIISHQEFLCSVLLLSSGSKYYIDLSIEDLTKKIIG